MMRSLYSGVAGLNTHQKKMDIIGNNIANVNTVAFKASQTTFSDVMYQNQSMASAATEKTGGVNAKQVGIGSTTASIKTTIESSGATQSTGEAFDIYLSDGKTTDFFVVSNGQETLFTRAGSFYLDGAGNLAMTSTGYIVQGWQAVEDAKTGEVTIQKDTVSPIRLLTEENNTSEPEATTDSYAYGIVDKNDANINSSNGFNMALSFYDSLGYEYTAKFNIKSYSPDEGTFTISLANIYDRNNSDILTTYRNETKATYLDNVKTDTSTDPATVSISKYPALYRGDFSLKTSDITGSQGKLIYTYTDANGNTQNVTYGVNGDNFTDEDGNVVGTTITADSTTDKPYVYMYVDDDGVNHARVMSEEEINDMLTAKVFGTEDGSSLSSYALKDSVALDEDNNISYYDSLYDKTYKFNMYEYNNAAKADGYSIPDLSDYDETDADDKAAIEAIQKNPNTIYKDKDGVYHMVMAHYTDSGAIDETRDYTLANIYTGANKDAIEELMAEKGNVGFNTKTGALEIKYRDVNYELDFNEASGAFDHIYRDGTNAVGLNLKNISGNFEDINIDFTSMIMANNGGSATAAMDTGNIEDPTLGTGRKLGILTGVSVQQNGQIYGSYDNGTTRLLAQIAVAQFSNASGLEALGNNLYSQTLNSGTFNGIGVEITSDGGKMVTGQLEMSNVDLSREFTEMITTQRGFQANSRIITVSDTMLEELTNLKR